MSSTPNYNQLYFEYEVLRSKYEIREHYLKTTVCGIYENIGQVLHALRLRIFLMTLENEGCKDNDENAGKLIKQVIRDLRYMCRSFYPDSDLLCKMRFTHILRYEIKLSNIEEKQLQIRGEPRSLEEGKETILSRMFQEMLVFIRKQEVQKSLQIKLIYGKGFVGLMISYAGLPVDYNMSAATAYAGMRIKRLSLQERAALLGASLVSTCRKPNRTLIKLVIPTKAIFYV